MNKAEAMFRVVMLVSILAPIIGFALYSWFDPLEQYEEEDFYD